MNPEADVPTTMAKAESIKTPVRAAFTIARSLSVSPAPTARPTRGAVPNAMMVKRPDARIEKYVVEPMAACASIDMYCA